MLQYNPHPSPLSREDSQRSRRSSEPDRSGDQPLEARVKPQYVELYPGVDPAVWYTVLQEGEYKDEMEGLWIQVKDWVTYVLAQHFDLQARRGMH
jgi:hypothetical protein